MPYPRRYNVALASGLVSTAALGWMISPLIDVDAAYPFKAAAFFGALFAGVAWVAGASHPYARFGPANCVTTVRAVLAALAAGVVGHAASATVLWSVIGLTAIVALLDGVDGWLARSTRMVSAYGARFDMETDAAFILVLSVLVWQHDKAGAWVLLCGLMRYALVAAGWLLPWLAGPLRATRRGRTVAIIQLVGLGAALAPIVPRPASTAVAAVTLASLVWSFGLDVAWLSHQYRTQNHR